MLLLRGYRKCIAKFVLPPLDVVHRHAESTKVDAKYALWHILNAVYVRIAHMASIGVLASVAYWTEATQRVRGSAWNHKDFQQYPLFSQNEKNAK